MKNVIIYIRAKTDLSEKSLNTVVAQAGQCKAYADDNGFNVVGFYSDISVFGSNQVCIGWDTIVNDPCPFYDYILVYDYGRLGRDIHSVINDLKSLHDRGINVVSVTGCADDRALQDILSALQERKRSVK